MVGSCACCVLLLAHKKQSSPVFHKSCCLVQKVSTTATNIWLPCLVTFAVKKSRKLTAARVEKSVILGNCIVKRQLALSEVCSPPFCFHFFHLAFFVAFRRHVEGKNTGHLMASLILQVQRSFWFPLFFRLSSKLYSRYFKASNFASLKRAWPWNYYWEYVF